MEIDRADERTRSETSQANRLSRRSFLRKFSSYLNNLPPLSQVLFGLTQGAPLLLFLWLLNRSNEHTEDRMVRVLRSLTVALLLFHLSVQFGSGMAGWLQSIPSWNVWAGLPNGAVGGIFGSLSPRFAADAWQIQLIVMGILAPTLLLLYRRTQPAGQGAPWTRGEMLLLGLGLLFSTAVIAGLFGLSAWILEAGFRNRSILPAGFWSFVIPSILYLIGTALFWLYLRTSSAAQRACRWKCLQLRPALP